MVNKKLSKGLILLLLICLPLFSGCAACTEKVPPGYAGMVMKPGGLTGEVLSPGSYSCWGRDRLILIETKEMTMTEKLSVLCADDLNFKFELKVRARLRKSASKNILDVLNRQGANIIWKGDVGILKADLLYGVYVKPAARPIARGIVSKYDTTQIRGAREAITKSIQDQLLKAVKGTPLEITLIATSNFDYPDVITRAVEKKREREISIEEEKAKQAVELLKADNRLKIAQKMKAVRAAEAEADAVAIQILGKSLTDKYLALKRIERDMILYRKVQQGDKVIITNGNLVAPIVGMNK
jgi:regulator of protease activity HflC (stomatin/prohibitin superfamily)